MSIPIYRMPSEANFAIVRMAPGVSISTKATLVSKEIVDSATARRSAAKKAINYVLNDRKSKKQLRAQPENVGSRSKYILFQQKGRALFYTEVDLFKADLESARAGANGDSVIEDAEQAEMERQKHMLARLQRHSKLNSFLAKGEADDDDIEPAARIFGRRKTVRKTQHELGLGDDQRDLDFEEEFDDDDAADNKVSIDAVGDGQGPEQIDRDQDLTQAGKKIAQILSKAEDLDDFSESDEDDEMGGDEDLDDEVPPEQLNRKRAIDVPSADHDSGSKRPRMEAASPAAASSPSGTTPPQSAFVTDEEVREQFRKHGRLTVKSLARIMEDTWKYKGDQARKELFAIVQRICMYQADPSRPGVKYLVLKP